MGTWRFLKQRWWSAYELRREILQDAPRGMPPDAPCLARHLIALGYGGLRVEEIKGDGDRRHETTIRAKRVCIAALGTPEPRSRTAWSRGLRTRWQSTSTWPRAW